jgi:hypothetical protein
LKLALIVGALIVYQIFASVYTFLSPLAGLFFAFIAANFKYNSLESYLAFGYLCFFELNQGFYLFSYVFLFVAYYYFVRPRLLAVFDSYVWVVSIAVVFGYVGLFFVNIFFAYLLNAPLPAFHPVYIFYIIIDAVLANMLLYRRER